MYRIGFNRVSNIGQKNYLSIWTETTNFHIRLTEGEGEGSNQFLLELRRARLYPSRQYVVQIKKGLGEGEGEKGEKLLE